jgi:hypothetical protein
MWRKLVALALVASVNSAPAMADTFETGQTFLDACENDEGPYRAYCEGYVIAVADIMSSQPLLGARACFPSGATKAQVRDVAIAWVKAHPDERDLSAFSLVAIALAQDFPC